MIAFMSSLAFSASCKRSRGNPGERLALSAAASQS
jgi:hypothetical protein